MAVDNLAVCADFSDDQWKEESLAEICLSSSKVLRTEDTSENSDVDSDSEEYIEMPPKFQNVPEAIACLENVHQFLELKGATENCVTDMFTYYATF